MDNKLTDIMKLQQQISQARKAAEESKKIAVVEEVIEVENTLPTAYVSATDLKLSAKEITHTTSYLDRLKQNDERYEAIKISEEKAKKIRRGLTRLTTGSAAVVPMMCKGNDCSFKSTCVTGDTKILMKNGSYKLIKDIIVNDKIYSFNTSTKSVEIDTIYHTVNNGYKDVYRIVTEYGNSIKVTSDHLLLNFAYGSDCSWLSIDEGLSVGSSIIVDDFDPLYSDQADAYGDMYIDTITSIDHLGQEEVYDISVKNNENFIANNIIAHNCPYFLEGVAPVNLSCLVELQLIEYWMEKYQTEFNVTDESITDMHMIARLCEYDIYDMRVTRYLAEHDQTLLTDFISSYTEEGDPISNKATSAAFEVKERIDRLRSKTLKELMATREAKAKILTTVSNASNNLTLAQMKSKFDELVKEKTNVKYVNNT